MEFSTTAFMASSGDPRRVLPLLISWSWKGSFSLGPVLFGIVILVLYLNRHRLRASHDRGQLQEWSQRSASLGLRLVAPTQPSVGLGGTLKRLKDYNIGRRSAGLPDERDPHRLTVKNIEWDEDSVPALELVEGGRAFRIERQPNPGRGSVDGVRMTTRVPDKRVSFEWPAMMLDEPNPKAEPIRRAVEPRGESLRGVSLVVASERIVARFSDAQGRDVSFLRSLAREIDVVARAVEALPDPPKVVPGPPLPTKGLGLWAPKIASPKGSLVTWRLALALVPVLWPLVGMLALSWDIRAVAFSLWGSLAGLFLVVAALSLRRSAKQGGLMTLIFLPFVGALFALVANETQAWPELADLAGLPLAAASGAVFAAVPLFVGRKRGTSALATFSPAFMAHLLLFFVSLFLAGFLSIPLAWMLWGVATLAQVAMGIGLVGGADGDAPDASTPG